MHTLARTELHQDCNAKVHHRGKWPRCLEMLHPGVVSSQDLHSGTVSEILTASDSDSQDSQSFSMQFC